MAQYNKITPELAEQMKTIVGADRFFMGEAINADYSHDEMPIYGKNMPEAGRYRDCRCPRRYSSHRQDPVRALHR